MRATHQRRLLWALALVATTASLVLAKSDLGNNQSIKKQDVASVAGKPIDSQQSVQAQHNQNHHQQQQVAEKKQGDQVVDSLFNGEEYVQIKPEEIATSGESSGKDIDPALLALADLPNGSPSTSNSQASSQQQPVHAEHKSAADDELSAHLAQDTIGALESGPRPYAAPAAADPRAARPNGTPARGGYMPPRHPGAQYHPRPPPRGYAGPRRPPQGAPPPMPGYGRGSQRGAPMVPTNRYPGPQLPGTTGYSSMNGNGMSSMVPHAPRPALYGHGPQAPQPHPAGYQAGNSGAPMSPAPRYLPRGAAAGYAAFRDFVRAQANRYKGQQQQPTGSHEPAAYNAAPPSGPNYGAAQGAIEMASGAYQQTPESKPYGSEAPMKAPAVEAPSSGGQEQYSGPAAAAIAPQAPKSKVTVAQAYIPHLTPSSVPTGYGQAQAGSASSPSSPSSSYATNPVLNKLYGGHAPQGVGRPEYNKDYGMVIHYPQATVYTEPMTVDQLHKLAGSSITQILEQLQYNLASGQRNEANTIRANNKHHLGHGLAIHAKEYYAPGKGGHYVPTTAAVISSHEPANGDSQNYGTAGPTYSSEMPQAPQQGGYRAVHAPQNAEAAAYGLRPELGSGYERVKAAAAASAMKYGPARPAQQMGGEHQQQYRQPSGGSYESSSMSIMKPYEPLGALANIIGSELESLYNKANSVLSKQLDPEIHAHVQAHLKNLAKVAGPLKFSEHDQRSPLTLRPHNSGSYGPPTLAAPHQQQQHGQYQGPPRAPHPSPPHQRGRAPRRPMGYDSPAPGGHRPTAPGRYPGPQPASQRPHSQRQGGYRQHQQQQAYNAEQQAFQHQMNQLLSDFNLGEDNYGAKSQPMQATNQGYPSKVMQKYQQQQQYQQQEQSSHPYEHSDGLEIPQGPNDQIGEISELIEALKGSLEGGHKPETSQNYQPAKEGKTEDVQYITSTLGQMPSYAIQVPVGQQQQQQQQQQYQQQQLSGESAVYEAAKKAEQQQQQHYANQAQMMQQQPAHYQQQQQPTYQQVSTQLNPQLPYQSPPAPVAQNSNSYEHASSASESPANGGRYQHQQQPQEYQQQQQQHQPQANSYNQYKQSTAGPQQEGYGAQSAAPAEAYGVQQQDSYGSNQPSVSNPEYVKTSSDYGQQQQNEQAAPASYAAPSTSADTYQQQQQQQPAQAPAIEHPSQQQSSYSSSEQTQVINHLVPAQQQQQGPAVSDYSSQQQHQKQPQPIEALTTSIAHQPVNQISVAAPTESQYQSAQPLSSFVDSLPSDYQELLRQPAAQASIMESMTGGHQEPLYSNATTNDITKTSVVPKPLASSVAVHSPASLSHHHHSSSNNHHQRLSRQYDSHHLTSSASSPKATYLQVPASSAASSSASSGTKSSVAQSSASSPSSSSISSSSSSSSSVSSASLSPSSSSSSSSSSAAKSPAASQQDTK